MSEKPSEGRSEEIPGWVEYFNGDMSGKEIVSPNGIKKVIVRVKPGEYRLKNGTPQRIRILSGKLKYSIRPFEEAHEVSQGMFFELPMVEFVFYVEHPMSYIATAL